MRTARVARETVELDEAADTASATAEPGLADFGWWQRFAGWRITGWQIGLVVAVAAYVTYFTGLTLDIHHGLGTSSYDSGLYDQGVWLMSRFTRRSSR